MIDETEDRSRYIVSVEGQAEASREELEELCGFLKGTGLTVSVDERVTLVPNVALYQARAELKRAIDEDMNPRWGGKSEMMKNFRELNDAAGGTP